MTRARQGFTLVETLVAVTLAVIFIGAGSMAFLYLLKSESIASTQSELDIDVRRAAERLKNQMRLSGLNEMVFYPANPVGNPPGHIAVGFPLPGDLDNDGVIDMDERGRVLWRSTLVYHPWPPSQPNSLRVTTFSPRDTTLSDAQRLEQVARVTEDGDARNTFNATNATTFTIFNNLFNWNIRPLSAIYDGYAPQTQRDRNVTFGSVVVNPGPNTLTFTIVGSDPAADEDKFYVRADTLLLTPSYLPREAEELSVPYYDGPQPQKHYEANAIYSANHQLLFEATEIGQSFTLAFENDCWEKVNFRDLGDMHRQTDVIFDDPLYPKRYILQLAGRNRNWEAITQSLTNTPTTGPDMHNDALRILLRGHEMTESGFASLHSAGCSIRFQAPNVSDQGLRIDAASIAESVSHVNPSPDINTATLQSLTFSNSPSASLNYDSTRIGPLLVESDVVPFEINPNKSYVVSVAITRSASGRQARPHYWNSQSATPSTYLYPGGNAAINQAIWSGDENLKQTNGVYLVESLFSTYANEGIFESKIADTRAAAPAYYELEWDQQVPPGTTLEVKIRSGQEPTLSDAPAWSNVVAELVSPSQLMSLDHKRYVQVRVRMTSNPDGTETPKLERFQLTWPGAEQIVDVGGVFTRARDGGRFEISVNAESLKTGVIVDMELFRDIRGFQQEGHQRLSSSIVAEVTPRNTRWDPDDD